MLLLTNHTARIDEIAGRSHGIVTTPELVDAGYSEAEIRTLVRKGHLLRIRRGVYAAGHLALGDDARRMAMVRCGGDGAALTSVSACAGWNITRRIDRPIDVVVPRHRRPIDGANIVVDQRIEPEGFTTLRGIPILTPTWSITTVAQRMGPGELARVMREASFRHLLDMSELWRIAERHDRRPGIVTLRKAIDLRTAGSTGYASGLERDVNRFIRGQPVAQPLPNVVVAVEGDALEVDMVWREFRICAEIDGPIHDDPDVQREDARRSKLLVAAGWTVIRIHWAAWEADRHEATAPLIALLPPRSSRNRA